MQLGSIPIFLNNGKGNCFPLNYGSVERAYAMNFFSGGILGFFFGFFFGAGCALALMYSIYSGGYRKAIEDSLSEEKTERYRRWFAYVEKRREKKRERAASGPVFSSKPKAPPSNP